MEWKEIVNKIQDSYQGEASCSESWVLCTKVCTYRAAFLDSRKNLEKIGEGNQ